MIIIMNSLEGSSPGIFKILSQHCHGGTEENHETWLGITGIKTEIQTGMSWMWYKWWLPVSALLIYLYIFIEAGEFDVIAARP